MFALAAIPLAGRAAAPPAKALPKEAAPSLPHAQPATTALFVTDEWHDLTRQDGTGLYFDLVRAVFKRQGVQVEFRIFPYPRAVQKVKDHEADGWIASFLHEKSFPLYPRYHFDKNEQTIVYRKSRHPGKVTTANLRNQRVAWLRDFGLDRFIHEPMQITELDSIRSAFQMLAHDRIDYFVGAKTDIDSYIRSERQNMQQYGRAYALHLGLYVAFANTPRGQALRQMWDDEMAQFHRNPAFKAIYQQYGYPYPFP